MKTADICRDCGKWCAQHHIAAHDRNQMAICYDCLNKSLKAPKKRETPELLEAAE